MITRYRLCLCLLLVTAGITVACQRVPLLAPTGSTITLTTAATNLPTNGTADIIAQVIEASGTPPQSGTHVTFSTTIGTVQPSDVETDINGRVTVKFSAGGVSGVATITAYSGGATTGSSGAIKINVGAAAVGRVVVSANPGTVSASGSNSTITAVVSDPNGNLLGGVPVTFTTTAGSFSLAVVNTDGNGNAQTTLTTNKTATVTATAGVLPSSNPSTPTTPTTPGSPTTPAPGGNTTSQQSATVTVTINSAPTISVGAPVPASPTVGQSVTFPLTGYSTDPNSSPVQSVTVDFGDGSRPVTLPGKPASTSHTYNAIGSYSVRATVIDALGDTSSATGSVSVGGLASITVGTPSPASPTVGQAVTFPLTFGAAGGSPIQRVVVDYGDGTAPVTYPGSTSSVSHVYTTGGTFAVRVSAFDAFNNVSTGGTSVLVSAKAQPTVSITTTTTNPTAGTDITFTASIAPAAGSGTVITAATVDFGDNTSTSLGATAGTAIAVHHVYQNGGTYPVVLTATDSNGGVGIGSTTVFVQTATPLTVLLSASGIQSGTNTTETFTATVIGLGNSTVSNYHWVFGGTNGTADNTSSQQVRTYPTGSGPITVTVTITTSTGAMATGQTVITP